MEQSRLIIALALSFAVFFAWNLFFSPTPPEKKEEVLQASPAQTSTTEQQAAKQIENKADERQSFREPKADGTVSQRQPRIINVNTALYNLSLSEKGASIVDMTLNKYRETADPESPHKVLIPKELSGGTVLLSLAGGNEQGLEQAVYTLANDNQTLDVQNRAAELRFSYTTPSNIVIDKSYRFIPDSYLIDLVVSVRNGQNKVLNDDLKISLRDLSIETKKDIGFIGPSGLINQKLEQIQIKKIAEKNTVSGLVRWIAIEKPYFMTSLVCNDPIEGKMVLDHQNAVLKNQLVINMDAINPNETREFHFALFMGPRSWSLLRSYNNDLDRAIDFGWVDILAKPCLWFMNFIYRYIPNYGIAILILTLITRLAFWPLAQKSYKSMSDMRKLQPLMQEIREKYKNDKARINQETMALYRTYKINPMGGCLPMVIQLPVFFALYRMLYQAIELRHAPFFGWINDLSAPDRLFHFNFKIPFMDAPYGIPVLTLIMGATMLLQQKMTPTPGDPAQAKMMMLMPVVFTVIFINFSSGLVLYWLFGNIISISQQYFTQRKLA